MHDGSQMDTVEVEKEALQCLLAAGWAIFKHAQHAQRAHATGGAAPDLRDQMALRRAIALAERACGLDPEPA